MDIKYSNLYVVNKESLKCIIFNHSNYVLIIYV